MAVNAQAGHLQRVRRSEAKSRRTITTPEGVALNLNVARIGSRFGALALDYLILTIVPIILILILLLLGIGVFGSLAALDAAVDEAAAGAVLQFLFVVGIIGVFLVRYGYFMAFELGPRGATPGKRAARIRVAAHDGGRLTASAVLARNLIRDIEFFLPLAVLQQDELGGPAQAAAIIWLFVFVLFPFFNRDRMRAGDLIAGTWVVDVPRVQLGDTLASADAARGRSAATGAQQYVFSDEELSVYGEYELQTLEDVLRRGNAQAIQQVQQAICKKIGWSPGAGDERAFLEAYYAQLRARLESNMRFGKRKADKFD